MKLRPAFLTGIVVLSCGIASCSGMLNSNQPAERVYWLEPFIAQQAVVTDSPQPSLSVSVSAAPGMDTDRLLILEPGARLNQYAAARWPDNFPEVLESLLRTTLESTGRYSRLTRGPTSRAPDQVLELEVRELYTLASERRVHMAMSGYISCGASDFAIALQATAGIADDRLSEIVAAYQQALNEVSRQLVAQLADACNDMTTD
jgi:ABC-type uncharacterized transport system auxiliary subunit